MNEHLPTVAYVILTIALLLYLACGYGRTGGMGMNSKIVKRTERGWAGHFICASRCLFHRNTLLEYDNIAVVVSTVGAMMDIHAPGWPNENKFDTIGFDRYYETMVFHTNKKDKRYQDIDVLKPVAFASNRAIDHLDADDEANDMHEAVVIELTQRLFAGNKLKPQT